MESFLTEGKTFVRANQYMLFFQGYSAETSGGLLMSISAEGAKAFADEIHAIEGQPAWVIGTVEVDFLLCSEYFSLFKTFFSGWQWEGQNCGQSDNN